MHTSTPLSTGYNLEKIWDSVLEGLKLNLTSGSFNVFFKNTSLMGITEAGEKLICVVGCDTPMKKNNIDQRFSGQIALELEAQLKKKCEVVIKVKPQTPNPKSQEEIGPLFDEKRIDQAAVRRANLKEDYTFENYAVGGSNQMAFAAAQAVATKPGLAYNPLFIYGGVGVGKTHLMQSIGSAVLKQTGYPVLFCSGEEFTNDLVEAIRLKSTDKVRSKYRKVKVLMIDDVQFIAGKPSVQEEFFHTFNTIQKEGGQVVMTSDRPPSEIVKLEERLRSRFGAGLIVDVGQPNFELRTAILLIKAKQRNINLDMKLAQMIATQIEGVRELEGFLTKLTTEIVFAKKELTVPLVESLLEIKSQNEGSNKLMTPAEVFNIVSGFYGVGIQQLKGERRTKTVAWPRQVLMYFLYKIVHLSLEEAGRQIGGRDHTTVLHGSNKVELLIDENDRVASEIREIRKRIVGV